MILMKFTQIKSRVILLSRKANRTMANRNQKTAGNVAGPFYVDDSCIDCDICRKEFPEYFSRNDDGGFSVVHRQPQTPAEWARAQEALESCPTESIGNDG